MGIMAAEMSAITRLDLPREPRSNLSWGSRSLTTSKVTASSANATMQFVPNFGVYTVATPLVAPSRTWGFTVDQPGRLSSVHRGFSAELTP
jgi:hypothetical protein